MAFLNVASEAEGHVRTLAETLAFTGCRLSEALAVTAVNVDVRGLEIHFLTLKRRKSDVWRTVPVPRTLIEHLDLAFGLRRRLVRGPASERQERLLSESVPADNQ